VKEFLSKTPHYVYGTLQTSSVKDPKTRPTQWRGGEFWEIRRSPSKSRLHAGIERRLYPIDVVEAERGDSFRLPDNEVCKLQIQRCQRSHDCHTCLGALPQKTLSSGTDYRLDAGRRNRQSLHAEVTNPPVVGNNAFRGMKQMKPEGKVARHNKILGSNIVITGSSGGLGSHLVKHFAAAGANVYGVDLVTPKHEVEGVQPITADLSKADGVRYAREFLSTRVAGLEILINCAGQFHVDPVSENAWETADKLWKANVMTTIMFTLQLEALLASGSNPLVVNVASTDGVVASGGQDNEIGVCHDILYAVSKGAVVTFTRALAMKWAPLSIRVNAVCPTIFPSPMTDSLLTIAGKEQELAGRIPLRRLCQTQDIVEAVDSIYPMLMTTGHLFPIDGGYLCQ
jgi:NAD(P)-dependent dehydrogenase (short-subunit alcohol dehydrogenase family)